MKKSTIVLAVLGVVTMFFAMAGCSTYNSMVTADESVTSQWSQVENVYQRRADLIPNLVATVKGYAGHEKETLTAVIEARSKATAITIDPSNMNAQSLAAFQQNQDGLSSALSKLMVVVEKYPELKANQNFLELQAQLEGTENRISVERKRFNDVTSSYNKLVRTFPANIWAGAFDFEPREYFKAQAGSEKAPQVSF